MNQFTKLHCRSYLEGPAKASFLQKANEPVPVGTIAATKDVAWFKSLCMELFGARDPELEARESGA